MPRPWDRLVRAVCVIILLSLGRGASRRYPFEAAGRYNVADNNGGKDDYTNSYLAALADSSSWDHPYGEHCSAGTGYSGVYPMGFELAESLSIFHPLFDSEDLTVGRCLEKCCDLGQEKCQFIWIFRNKCIAVSCSQSRSLYCDYTPVPPHLPHSYSKYITVQFNHSPNVPTSSTSSSSSSSPVNHMTSSSQAHIPPEISITPVNLVTINSEVSLSAQLSDHHKLSEGAVEYYWKLVTAEPPRNQLDILMSDTRSSTVHLSSLSPGVYVFQLNVTDSTSGLTNSANSTVTVLPDQKRPPLAVSIVTENAQTLSQNSMATIPIPSIPKPSKTSLPTTKSNQTGPPTTIAYQPKATYKQKQNTANDQIELKPTTDYQIKPKMTKVHQTEPKQTITRHGPPTPPAMAQEISPDSSSSSSSSSSSDFSNYVKVGVPVLSIVLIILVLSGGIVAVSSCFLFNNQDKPKYRYRRLIYTDA